MRIRHLSVAALAIVALSTTGCSNVFLSMDDSLGFKAHDGGTSANTYLEITAYQWQDNQAGEKVAGPWVWQVPVTDGGRTNWAATVRPVMHGSKYCKCGRRPIIFHYRAWRNDYVSGTQVQVAELDEGWSQVVAPVRIPTTVYVSHLDAEAKDGSFDWWVQCRISPDR